MLYGESLKPGAEALAADQRNTSLFRENYWEFPEGVSNDEMKEKLAENYFQDHGLIEKEDWNFIRAYSWPSTRSPIVSWTSSPRSRSTMQTLRA